MFNSLRRISLVAITVLVFVLAASEAGILFSMLNDEHHASNVLLSYLLIAG